MYLQTYVITCVIITPSLRDLEASLPVNFYVKVVSVGLSVSVGVSPMMQLTGNLSEVLCPLHAGTDLTHWDSMMAYNISGVAHNVGKSYC